MTKSKTPNITQILPFYQLFTNWKFQEEATWRVQYSVGVERAEDEDGPEAWAVCLHLQMSPGRNQKPGGGGRLLWPLSHKQYDEIVYNYLIKLLLLKPQPHVYSWYSMWNIGFDCYKKNDWIITFPLLISLIQQCSFCKCQWLHWKRRIWRPKL